MNWFFIALITPIVHSVANFIDKFLVSKYFHHKNIATLLIYSSFSTFILLPIFLLIDTKIFSVSLRDISFLMLAGVFTAIGIYFYLYALNKDDTSIVVPFFQLVPIFSYILSYLVLGESLTGKQIIGALIVILGAAVLSVEFDALRKIKIRYQIVLAMIAASFFISLEGVLFKFIAVENNFWLSSFWEYLGAGMVGVLIFLLSSFHRKDFIGTLKKYGAKITAINFSTEVLTLGGYLSLNYAFLLAPIVLVRVVESYQPLFVFTLGIIITALFPKIIKEKTSLRYMIPKIAAILIIFIGSYFVF